ncbi:PIG-L family deacetylase [Algoriphagus halophytocola]|uniref:PIG-L family deacetylase n=1 Tax=Algoriphagus halophytocola TaxID=2991499 RepID=UPI0022DE4206|nr:PIG-L family deacetylase [Algoriphagus sp. TR-M9]WBL45084.1 PIG-L family deacetylase [Algoriphagus sp. TR-M9]
MTQPKVLGYLIALVFLNLGFSSFAQNLTSSQIYHQLLRLKETKRVLYVAAHPDDENTRLIATLVNGEHAEVGYLSLTRGDGGQNLLGKQLGIELGQIRTQELLKARETDGGRQFFTRAMDFGYSKNPDETLQNWDKQKVLADVVWTVRKFRPDIMITRFNTIPGGNHGHHTTSAILAGEAFELASDPTAFPEQLQYVEPWQPKRLFWNTYNFGGDFEPEVGVKYAVFEVGEFNPLLGKTYSQIAADSRTMHKSQGFGATASIGEAKDHLEFLEGDSFEESAFEGISDRWGQISGGEDIKSLLDLAIKDFDFQNPVSNLDQLLKIRQALLNLDSKPRWVLEKTEHLEALIFAVLGLDMELTTNTELGYPGSEVKANLVFNNPSDVLISDISLDMLKSKYAAEIKSTLHNKPISIPVVFQLTEDAPLSQPYWLEQPVKNAIYDVRDQKMIGKPFQEMKVGGKLSFTLKGQSFTRAIPLMYKFNDQVDGEVQQPFTIVPKIDLEVSDENVFILPGKSPLVTISVNFRDKVEAGRLTFENLMETEYEILGETQLPGRKIFSVSFQLEQNQKKEITANYITDDGEKYDQIVHRISYQHIPNLTYFSPASINLIQEDWKISGDQIGYIMGAGDDVPSVLQSLGYPVIQLGESDFSLENLRQYPTIVVGIRAYNTNKALADNHEVLMEYVKQGGNLVVQYNVSRPLLSNELGPYRFDISRDRVTVEGSPFSADFDHPVLAGPNQIEKEDFEGWIQERGLYFVTNQAPEYSSPLSFQDPGEDPTHGSLIFAEYGEGTFTYTGISFFRELPAGVPGAIKLFINLIEQ